MRLRAAVGCALLIAVVAAVLVARGPEYALDVEPDDPRAGESIRLRTTAPGDMGRGRYVRMERREGDRWRPVLDLAPAWEWGPAHAKPAVGHEAGGLLKAFSGRGVITLEMPEDVTPGRYRLRQRLIRRGPRIRDLYAEFDLRAG